MTDKLAIIISQGRGPQSPRRSFERQLANELAGWPNTSLTTLPHLYDLAPDGPGMAFLRSLPGDMVVLASLYPRATYWLLDANEIKGRMGPASLLPDDEAGGASAGSTSASPDGPQRTIWCLDLRSHQKPEPVLEEIRRMMAAAIGEPVVAGGEGRPAAAAASAQVEEMTGFRWYPVVDYGRCANCLECLNFCLFGVFGVDVSERLIVEQPDACRDGCPACSRVCPSQAIMFPEHQTPAIGGDAAAAADTYTPDLLQLGGLGGGLDIAADERDRALAGESPQDPSAEKSDLDALVDEMDEMDL
ncbi:MAG: ferredoxin family protein [Pirellulales bacterium]|nr:ferredoxin family protein [Pirellulales bacterium]